MLNQNKKIKLFASAVVIFFCIVTFYHCSSSTEVVLEEIKAKKVPKDEKIPPIVVMINEIEEVEGVQKFVYFRADNKNIWLKDELKGLIFNDVSQKELVGKIIIKKIYDTITKGEILELYYPIQPKAIVVIEVDPRQYIK